MYTELRFKSPEECRENLESPECTWPLVSVIVLLHPGDCLLHISLVLMDIVHMCKLELAYIVLYTVYIVYIVIV